MENQWIGSSSEFNGHGVLFGWLLGVIWLVAWCCLVGKGEGGNGAVWLFGGFSGVLCCWFCRISELATRSSKYLQEKQRKMVKGKRKKGKGTCSSLLLLFAGYEVVGCW